MYAIRSYYALIASGDLTNLTLAATFLRQAQKELKSQGEESNPFKDFAKMIMLFVNHKLGKKPTSGHEIVEARNRFLHFHFLGAVMTWFGKPLKKSIIPDQINEYGEFEYRVITSYSIHYTKLYELWVCQWSLKADYLLENTH